MSFRSLNSIQGHPYSTRLIVKTITFNNAWSRGVEWVISEMPVLGGRSGGSVFRLDTRDFEFKMLRAGPEVRDLRCGTSPEGLGPPGQDFKDQGARSKQTFSRTRPLKPDVLRAGALQAKILQRFSRNQPFKQGNKRGDLCKTKKLRCAKQD